MMIKDLNESTLDEGPDSILSRGVIGSDQRLSSGVPDFMTSQKRRVVAKGLRKSNR